MRPLMPAAASYRVQLNADFTFAQARDVVPYFDRLGVSHLYCSPIFAARWGSRHGYDVIDPARVNPELGGEDALRALAGALHGRGMGLIVDIVPNHMAVSHENPYWDDVLAHGPRSRWARWFDVDWQHGRIVLPLLGDALDRVLERNEIAVQMGDAGDLRLSYFDRSFPLGPDTLPPELQLAQIDLEEASEALQLFRGADPDGRRRLRAVLGAQHYELTDWRTGTARINYRRFFDVSDLVALRMEDRAVFDETHALILRLVRDGVVDGLRIDHVDGLRDPPQYLAWLRDLVGDRPIVVEKILLGDEELRETWPVDGTTGYDFLADVDALFIDPAGFAHIERCYRRLRRMSGVSFADFAYAGKLAALKDALRADVVRVADLLPGPDREEAVRQFIAILPIYRTYAAEGADDVDRRVVAQAISDAVSEDIRFIGDVVLGRAAVDQAARREFVARLEQTSGPAAAKGIEDTAHYVYVPLASRNEVGTSPDRPLDDAVARFHRRNARRATRWPRGLTCVTTHDTKRSADVRARLNALSEMPQEWDRVVRRWRRLNAKHRATVRGRLAPDTNLEYLLYQTLVGIWPSPRPGRRSDDLPDRTTRQALGGRIEQYVLKAAREAKRWTSWASPDARYEDALRSFVRAILEPADDAPFLMDVARLVSRVAPAAQMSALSRTLLHLTSPGTPDIYQGDELWNFTLVDPDNRRPVDYDVRARLLDAIEPTTDKLAVIRSVLRERRTHPDLFGGGAYEPLVATGERSAHVVAYVRSRSDTFALVVASRWLMAFAAESKAEWWADTRVVLPESLRGREWRRVLAATAEPVTTSESLELARMCFPLPLELLVSG
jgi:(1->4)-alpha-D-glucan 1-alpha-D-glucosylmutase